MGESVYIFHKFLIYEGKSIFYEPSVSTRIFALFSIFVAQFQEKYSHLVQITWVMPKFYQKHHYSERKMKFEKFRISIS